MSQTFDEAQINAASYAARERKYKRYTYWFLAAAVFGAVVSLMISPKLLLPSLVFSAVSYVAVRYGAPIVTWAKHKWLNWKAQRQSPSQNISMQSLLPAGNVNALREMANNELKQAATQKKEKIKHYEENATLMDDIEPLPYYDYKHKRALFQYRMLQSTQEAALKGQSEFINLMTDERAERRQIKIQILEMLKRDYVDTHKLSVSLKYIERSSAGKCTLGGTDDAVSAFVAQLKALNNGGRTPLVTLPANPDNESEAIMQTLLPLVLDLDSVVAAIPLAQRRNGDIRIGAHHISPENTYPISSQMLAARIDKLKKAGGNVLENNYDDETSSERSFELRV
jgi:hypothetical protein